MGTFLWNPAAITRAVTGPDWPQTFKTLKGVRRHLWTRQVAEEWCLEPLPFEEHHGFGPDSSKLGANLVQAGQRTKALFL